MEYKLRRYQIKAVNLIIKKFHCRALLADEMGLGKACKNGTKVLTSIGWKNIEEISLTDKVCGSDGLFHSVLGVYPQGTRECYEITFNKHHKIICDKDHLWTVQSFNMRHKTGDYKTLTAEELYKQGFLLHNKAGYYAKWYLPVVKPICFDEKAHFISPRMLGILIGEGSLSYNSIIFSTIDKEIIQYVSEEIKNNGYELVDAGKYSYRITKHSCINSYVEEIRRLGLNCKSIDKFIPDEYLYDCVENRLALLQGLMDTDGTVGDSHYQYDTSSKELAENVQFLAESLGCVVWIKERKTKYKGKDGNYVQCQNSYGVRIRPPEGLELFTLPRHLLKYHAKEHKYNAAVKITDIEPIGKNECTCIAIDSEDHLFVTEHCILTHNTIQAIKIMQRTKYFPVVICCPAFLKYNWVSELKKFAPEINYYVCSGQTPKLPKKIFDVYIINYDVLKFWVQKFLSINIQFLVFDESHFVKNKSAQRTKAALKLSQRVERVLLMTGTPIENRPVEIFFQIALINPGIFPNWLKFAKRYNSCRRTMFGWQMGKARHTKELNEILTNTCMIRRRKEDVLTELPPIVRQVIPLEIDNRQEYDEAQNDIIDWIAHNTDLNIQKAKRVEAQIRLDKLKYISAMGKLEQIVQWIDNESENQKLVVFCYHKKILKALNERLKNHILFSSDIETEQRQRLVESFQNDPTKRVFLTTLRVGGTGLTLTASHTTVFVQLEWNPGLHNQAEDRVHRIGQTADSVNAVYFIAKDTVEEKILGLIDGKRSDIRRVIDGEEVKDGEILTKLLETFTN